jgi:hypothetical protein
MEGGGEWAWGVYEVRWVMIPQISKRGRSVIYKFKGKRIVMGDKWLPAMRNDICFIDTSQMWDEQLFYLWVWKCVATANETTDARCDVISR